MFNIFGKKLLKVAAITGLLLGLASCGDGSGDRSNFSYEVSGSASNYSVTYENAYGSVEQQASVGSGWRYQWQEGSSSTRFMYISAQNNRTVGDVTVKIIKDGKVLKQATSSGAYVIATASR